ncbi:LysR family transcriptional regulator [Umezawaea beigongshangensis]|uniref:LysR family transcriptional regulator n=1 Tax=Umezawaea beigongshangensis TaxID=2780383 RepID=UPI0018F1BA60|nr:LysR family transcriptional regulator [Umezawaea beigongshangensis]
MAEFTLVGLRVMVEVARTGSFSAAAESLGYTQSAVSRQVAATERTASVPLFERHARGVRPTAAGEALVRHAARVLDALSAAGQELAGMRDQLAGRLGVGGFPTAMAVLVPRAVAQLQVEHPGIDVRLTEAPTPALLTAVRRGRLQVAVVAVGAGLPDYDLTDLELHVLVGGPGAGVAVCESSPLASSARLTPEDLREQTWIAGPQSTDRPEFDAWPGLTAPRIAHRAKDWPTRLGLVAAGIGIALVPGIAAGAVPRGVRWVPVTREGELGRHLCVATRGRPTPAAEAMTGAIRRQLPRITEPWDHGRPRVESS